MKCNEFKEVSKPKLYLTGIKYGAILISIGALVFQLFQDQQNQDLYQLIHLNPLLQGLSFIAFLTVVMTGLFYAWLAFHAFRYRPVSGVGDSELPTVTVVVPAYNEGELVLHTLRSLDQSDYPKAKLQLIAVDDGSKDDTWKWIERAREELPGRVLTVKMITNGGKRKALFEGIKRATGEILVTVDSDSVVEPNTLRNLVSPFVNDKDCGAVAGNIRVLNLKKMIPRMLDVSFVFSFEFVRSAQSHMRTVLCTPGALAAYRRTLVLDVLPDWMNQTFLGQAAKIGEDRALTNLILSRGYSVLFQSNAIVYTDMPEKLRNLSKMFIRWGRSNVRENFKMQGYVFSRFRTHHRWSARLLFFMQQWWCTMSVPLFLFMLSILAQFPLKVLITALAGNALWGTLHALFYCRHYRWRDSLWAFPYGIYHFAFLSWIASYSYLTMRRSGWLTRNLPETKVLPIVTLKKTVKVTLPL